MNSLLEFCPFLQHVRSMAEHRCQSCSFGVLLSPFVESWGWVLSTSGTWMSQSSDRGAQIAGSGLSPLLGLCQRSYSWPEFTPPVQFHSICPWRLGLRIQKGQNKAQWNGPCMALPEKSWACRVTDAWHHRSGFGCFRFLSDLIVFWVPGQEPKNPLDWHLSRP